MPRELKPEDVMRAIECCLQADGAPDCYKLNCPARLGNGLCYYEIDCEFNSEEEALKKMLADALIILRENRSQISVLKKLLERCETQFAEKDAEIERLTINMNAYGLTAKNLAKEFEDYRADVQMEIADARAEAITEFAERLKEAVKYIPWCEYPPVHNCIDQIAKEMKGE